MKISVMLVDDHTILREGLNALLEQSDDFVVVTQAENGVEAIQKYETFRPDVVVMDLTMPVMSGIDATRAIVETYPEARVLALSMVLDKSCAV